MTIEVILGSNTSGSGTFTANPDFTYSQPSLVAAWSGGASSVSCSSGKIQFGTWDPSSSFKMLVWDNSGNLIGTSDATAFTPNDTFIAFTFSTPVTIVKGSTYRLGWVSNGASNTRPWGNGTGGSIHRDTTHTYSSTGAWSEESTQEATKNLSGYLEAETGPPAPPAIANSDFTAFPKQKLAERAAGIS